jgi:hypothetical protein
VFPASKMPVEEARIFSEKVTPGNIL